MMVNRKNRPNRYYIKAITDLGNVLTLSDDGKFYKETARPMYFKQPRLAASYWFANARNADLSTDYSIKVQGPRGGFYDINMIE